MRKGLDPEDYLEVGDPDPNIRLDLKGMSYRIDLDLEQSRQLLELAERRGVTTVALAKELVLEGLAQLLSPAKPADTRK
jgi:hypothetical protein